ncbi:MAG: LTA synthase family protein [Bacillota bacterium]
MQARNYNIQEKAFTGLILISFLAKYNYILQRIFYIPIESGLILRNIAFLVIFTGFVLPLIKNKRTLKYIYIAYLAFTGLFLLNYFYYGYFGNYFSLINFIMSENIGRPGNILVFFRRSNTIYLIILLLDFILITALYFKLRSASFRKQDRSISYTRRRTWLIPLLLVIIILVGQIYFTNRQLGSHNPRELYQRSTAKFVNVYGFLPLYLMEIDDLLNPTSLKLEEPSPPPEGDNSQNNEPLPGVTNIIAIQVETLDEKLIGYEHNGTEITPFLNSLKDQGRYYPNFYTQHLQASFDAGFSFLTSLYPVNRNYPYRMNDLNKFNSLVSELNEIGYRTLAFHGYDGDFFNRDEAFADLGFDHFYAESSYSPDELEMEASDALGINDYDFFKQSLEMLDGVQEPFFGFFITVSTHKPYDYYPEAEKIEAFQDIEDEVVRNYFNSIHFSDRSLEMFFAGLEEKGLRENSLIIIYSDHESLISNSTYKSGRDYNLSTKIKPPEHVPLFIVHPELEPKTVESSTSILDLAPTILDAVGKTDIPQDFLGRSLLDYEEYPLLFMQEVPQIVHDNQLYLFNGKEFDRVGYLDEGEDERDNLSEDHKNKIRRTIKYLKSLYLSRRED